MNKYLVCHSHISVEPEAVGVDRVISFTEMESVLNEDCVLIVSDIVHASLIATYIKNIQKNPNCVYGLSGLWIDVTDKNIENCTTVVKFDRSFTGQRYTTLDYGNQPVHVFDKPSYALNPSKVKIRPVDSCYLFSSELEKAGIPRVVVDTKLWGGPRINMPRFTTFNFKASLFRSLASTEWKVLPRPEDKEEEDESEGIMPDPLEQKEYDFDELPDVMVMMTTHNRTDTALATIESLVKHLKYPKLKWCICDDRSEEGHVARLADKFFELGVEDVKICRTNDERWGLGASMNNGLRACFDVGPVAFTTEDDWLLDRDLDLKDYVSMLINDSSTCVIRLACLWNVQTYTENYKDGLMNIKIKSPGNNAAWVFSNQVALRHRRVYDLIGLYKENCTPDDGEGEMRTRFNKLAYNKLKVLWPSNIPTGTLSDKNLPFRHFGVSTVGHAWTINNIKTQDQNAPFFRIITPAYNTGKFLNRCAESLMKQSFKDFVWVIVDDASKDNTASVIKKLAKTYPCIKYKILSRHVDAGGARNVALSISESKYTLYLDSDDNVVNDTNILQKIHDAIVESSYPDVVKLGYINSGKECGIVKDLTVDSLCQTSPGPPMNCHKSAISPRFIQYRRQFNDTLWFLRLCDCATTVISPNIYWFVYNHDNNESAEYGTVKNDPIVRAAAYYVVADLLCERFAKPCVTQRAKQLIDIYRKNNVS